MRLKLTLAALVAAPTLAACTTDELDMFDTALSLYSDISYLNGDCPFGMNKYHDREGHHFCTYEDDVPQRSDHHRRHHDED